MAKSTTIRLVICLLLKQFNATTYNAVLQEEIRKKIKRLNMLYLLTLRSEEKGQKGKRKYWVRPIFTVERRLAQGASANLIEEMQEQDEETFCNYFRMQPAIFNDLLKLVGPLLAKQSAVREPIPPETRLHITVRYLASGDSMRSLSYAFRVAHNTVSKVISETNAAIWTCLKDKIFLQDNEESWKNVADNFERLWNFPNCSGAVDGKHVNVQV